MKKLLFLDIDGVLNPNTNIWYRKKKGEPTSSYYIKLPGDKIYRLKKIIDITGADIVITSSWRIGYRRGIMEPSPSMINLSNQLANYGLHISGCTPLHYDRHRGNEISHYLNNFYKENKYIPKYIIIDDNISDIVPDHRGHIIQTTTLLGLQDEHVNIAINLLNK